MQSILRWSCISFARSTILTEITLKKVTLQVVSKCGNLKYGKKPAGLSTLMVLKEEITFNVFVYEVLYQR